MADGTLITAPSDPANPAAPATPAAAPAVDPAKPAAVADPAKPAETAKADPAKDPATKGAPEKYDAFKVAEGVKLDDAVTGEFQSLAKELNLTQEQAQKMFDLGAKLSAKTSEGFQAQVAEMQTQWEKDTKADKEFGGEKLNENLGVAKKAMEAFASPELRTLLNDSKLGNHPEVIRLFYKVGQAISEDKLVTGRQPGASTGAPVFSYPNSKHA